MKSTVITLIAAAGLLAGCQSQPTWETGDWDNASRRDTNEWLLRTYFDTQTKNAIVRQHTLYDHHFVSGTADLNPRGERDLSIIAEHYARIGGGTLRMPRGDARGGLYERRLASVRAALSMEGLDPSAVEIVDEIWTADTQDSPRAGADYAEPSDEMPYSFHQEASGN
jgi:hypothetical protein